MEEKDPVYLFLMGNCKTCENKNIKNIYDLKGSMIKREEKPPKGEKFKNTDVLKDINFLKMKS